MEADSTLPGVYGQKIDYDALLTYAKRVLTEQQFCEISNHILFDESYNWSLSQQSTLNEG